MTLAVLLPGSYPPVADRLAEQLRAAGAGEVLRTDDVAGAAREAERRREPLLICAGDLVAHTAVLKHLITTPGPGTVALVVPDGPGAPVREERGLLVPGGTPTGVDGGAVRVGVVDLPTLGGGTPLDDLLAAGATITAHRVRLLVARRVADAVEAAAAEGELATIDEDAAELRLSVKERDDFFTTYAVSTWSPLVTKAAARLGLTPTAVTALSVLLAVVAAGLFAYGGGRLAWVAGGILLYLGFVLDCVDGQLARYTRVFSPFGGWLDTIADRVKEYLVYAGLAIGAERGDLGPGWALAIAAIVLQTVRHMTDTWYGVLHDEAAKAPSTAPRTDGVGGRLSAASNRVQADTGSVGYWLKRTVVFPIGERWALIALAAALFDPEVALIAVLLWGGLAFAYTLLLRTLRARSMRADAFASVDLAVQRDDGPLAAALGGRLCRGPLAGAALAAVAGAAFTAGALAGLGGGDLRVATVATAAAVVAAGALPARAPHTRATDFLVPAALRAAEYLFVVAVGVGYGVPAPVTYALLFALALRHYDLTARVEKRSAPPPLHSLGLGWDGRVVVLAVAATAGVAGAATGILAGYLATIFLVGSTLAWAKAAKSPQARASHTTMA